MEGAAVPSRFARTIEVGGIKKIFEGASEAEVVQAENEFLKGVFAQATSQQEYTPAQPIVTDAAEVTRLAELELSFKRGDISAADYLAKSGALDTALEAAGIPSPRSQRFEKSWAEATDEFLQSAAGADWAGGEQNFQTIGEVISTMVDADGRPLIDQPSAATLEAAYLYMKEKNLVVENADASYQEAISRATSASEIAEIHQKYFPRDRGGSGVFSR